MKSKIIITKLLSDIIRELNSMSDSDISKIEDGDYSISAKIVKNKLQAASNEKKNGLQKDELLKKLEECKSRDEGHEILTNHIKNKKDLEVLARFLEISVLKQDNIDQIREKIIEATIGAILRSNAIQGKTA